MDVSWWLPVVMGAIGLVAFSVAIVVGENALDNQKKRHEARRDAAFDRRLRAWEEGDE